MSLPVIKLLGNSAACLGVTLTCHTPLYAIDFYTNPILVESESTAMKHSTDNVPAIFQVKTISD